MPDIVIIPRAGRADQQRCQREIAAMEQQDGNAPAWLVALGISDWQAEMELLLQCAATDSGSRITSRMERHLEQHTSATSQP